MRRTELEAVLRLGKGDVVTKEEGKGLGAEEEEERNGAQERVRMWF